MYENLKILSYIDDIEDSYDEVVMRLDDLPFYHKSTIRTIEFYSDDRYLSGNKDELGREKPFYNIGNYRLTTAKTATDIDVKELRYEPDSINDSVPAMIINHEMYKYFKESNFSETLNDMGKTRPKYGGLLIKKVKDGDKLEIQIVEWINVIVDPVDILGGCVIEEHNIQASELKSKDDVWENVDKVLTAHIKHNKNKPARIKIKEITGQFPKNFDPDNENKEDYSYNEMCFYVAVVGTKKFYLYHEYLKDKKDKYNYLAWDKRPGVSLGRGVIEAGFESQVWVNDAMISMKNVMDISGKVIAWTNSQRADGAGNILTDIQNGHLFELEKDASMGSLNLSPSAMPQLETLVGLWQDRYDKESSTYDANTGGTPPSGTPYSQTALLNQIANSPFEYQREVWGIFLNEIMNDWIFPHIKKRIMKEHYLTSEFSDDELELIDESINAKNKNKMIIDKILKSPIGQGVPSQEDMDGMDTSVNKALSSFKSKREIEIPKDYLDVKGRMTANITGELKNKQATLQSLDNILKTIVSTFNPNTGSYAALDDPVLSEVFRNIVETAGLPMSLTSLRKGATKPTPQADVSAVAPQLPAKV